MKKNVYSLILSEGVVDAVDALACRRGTNRSALINEILAEYVSYVTPEMRVKRVLSRMEALLREHSFRLAPPSETMLTAHSSLVYKYNPTVRYSFSPSKAGGSVGEVKVSLRTQNATLIEMVERFYYAFIAVERRALGDGEYKVENGKFSRVLRLRETKGGLSGMISSEGIGELVAAYVTMLDRALKAYFSCIADENEAYRAVERVYARYMSTVPELI